MLKFDVNKIKKALTVSVSVLSVLSTVSFGTTTNPSQARAEAVTFTHGGILYSQADFDRAKQKVAAGTSPWIEAWNAGKASSYASSTYTPHPKAAPARWGNAAWNVGNTELTNDSEAALIQAIIWKVSSNSTEANTAKTKAEEIVDAWSSTVNTAVGGDEVQLLAGMTGLRLAAAADILQADSTWVDAGKFTAAKSMLRNYFYPNLHVYLANHYNKNGTTYPYYYRGNQDTTAMAAIMAIGILCDDSDLYNEGVDHFKNGNFNGRVTNYIIPTTDSNLAESEESGRDQAHPQLGIGMLADMAQMSYIQHTGNAAFEDLYEYSDRLILKGFEFSAKYNNGGTVPFTPIWTYTWRNEPVVSEYVRGQVRPIDEMVWNHYHNIKGLADSVPTDPVYNTKARVDFTWPEPIHTDHPPFTTLLYSQANAERPTVPTNLTGTFTTSNSQINLSWTPSTDSIGVVGYAVFRNSAQIGTTTTPTYTDTDTGLSAGTPYFYAVKAYDSAGNFSATSNTASVTTYTYTNSNIGAVGLVGSYSYNNGTFTVKGSGSDIWGSADQFDFASIPMTGDGTVIARVYSQENTNSWAKAGVMIRETLNTGSRYASVFITPSNGAAFQWRSSTNGTTSNSIKAGLSAPYWVKLVRSGGNTFTGYVSPDGVTWTQISSTSITNAASTVYVGLAVTSHDNTKLSTVVFDNVSIN